MATVTGMGLSPISGRVYWGRQNRDTGMWVGDKKKDITNEFLQVMNQKFPINTKQNITANGDHVSTFFNVAASKDVLVFDTINPDDIDTKKFMDISALTGLNFFNDHGSCHTCVEDLAPDFKCECKSLQRKQTMAMQLSKKD